MQSTQISVPMNSIIAGEESWFLRKCHRASQTLSRLQEVHFLCISVRKIGRLRAVPDVMRIIGSPRAEIKFKRQE
jgi:hypothetical protein